MEVAGLLTTKHCRNWAMEKLPTLQEPTESALEACPPETSLKYPLLTKLNMYQLAKK